MITRAHLSLAAGVASAALVVPASASEPRSRGLGGELAQRHITEPRNAMALIVGPLQPQLFGLRYASGVIDGGLQYTRNDVAADVAGAAESSWFASGGVAFGLFDDLEAGALFLRFELAPDFAYDDVNVYITHQFRLGALDAALRLSFRTPTRTDWALAPSLPVLVRLGHARLDTGAFLAFELGDEARQGLNIPARFTYNITPHWFFGAQTALFDPDFGVSNDVRAPAGVFAGYTLLMGARVADVALSFDWDDLLLVDPPEGTDALQPGSYRIVLGVTLHGSVM
jgi:hypothetical protein